MRIFRCLPVLLLLTACGSQRDSVNGEKAVEQQEANGGVSTGRVTTEFAGDGCPLLIKLDGVGGTFLWPIGLDDKFKQNGLKLKFRYAPSRARTGECLKGQPVTVENVEIITLPRSSRQLEDR